MARAKGFEVEVAAFERWDPRGERRARDRRPGMALDRPVTGPAKVAGVSPAAAARPLLEHAAVRRGACRRGSTPCTRRSSRACAGTRPVCHRRRSRTELTLAGLASCERFGARRRSPLRLEPEVRHRRLDRAPALSERSPDAAGAPARAPARRDRARHRRRRRQGRGRLRHGPRQRAAALTAVTRAPRGTLPPTRAASAIWRGRLAGRPGMFGLKLCLPAPRHGGARSWCRLARTQGASKPGGLAATSRPAPRTGGPAQSPHTSDLACAGRTPPGGIPPVRGAGRSRHFGSNISGRPTSLRGARAPG